MKTFIHIIFFEWKILIRSNVLKALVFVVLASGIYAIYYGNSEIKKQEERIKHVESYEKKEFDKILQWARLDTVIEGNKEKYQQAISPTGSGWNKHFTYYFSHKTPPLAGLCLGQRDLFPVYYGINITDLTRQLNTGELVNPTKLLSGNFDLSYVFVFLFPLLIIALFYNLYSSEKETGTLSLLQSQSASLNKILINKGIFRLLIVWSLAVILLMIGVIAQNISIDVSNIKMLIKWIVIVLGYCLFWVVIMGIIIRLRKESALNAMLGVSVWLVFTLVVPALLNLLLFQADSLPDRSEVIHAVRNLNDKNWESPKSFVLNKFYKDYPQYNKQNDTLDFDKWYYASFTLLDKEANKLKVQFDKQVNERNMLMNKWKWLSPAAMVHGELSKISNTDRESQLKFLQKVYANHKELQKIYHDRIFNKKKFSIEDLEMLKRKL